MKLYNQYTKECVKDFETENELNSYLFSQTENGIYRTWSIDNKIYYDCGRYIYFIIDRRNKQDNTPKYVFLLK